MVSIPENLQLTSVLPSGFFGVKLHTDHIIPADDRILKTAVIRQGQNVMRLLTFEHKRVNKVEIIYRTYVAEHKMAVVLLDGCRGNARSFQPICGIFRDGSSVCIGTTSPSIQFNPAWAPCSRPRVAMSCIPTQIPRKGVAFSLRSP